MYADSLLPMLAGEMREAVSFDEALVKLPANAEAGKWGELDE
ncbi:MAG: hypothetical protein ABI583_14695 [Betaproteobacteria bacterium]